MQETPSKKYNSNTIFCTGRNENKEQKVKKVCKCNIEDASYSCVCARARANRVKETVARNLGIIGG